jgi:hypothetical protein
LLDIQGETMTNDNGDPQAKGGRERAKNLSKEQRSEIARLGGLAKAAKDGKALPLLAKYGAEDRPLVIDDIKIPCYVLADGTRVLAQRGLQAGIGLGEGGGKGGARRIPALLEKLAEKGLDIRGLIARTNAPIRFIPPHGGNPALGYEATILPDLCAVLIDADRQRLLTPSQKTLAKHAAILQHGFATVGIIALVDEATGYQDVRQRDALEAVFGLSSGRAPDRFLVKGGSFRDPADGLAVAAGEMVEATTGAPWLGVRCAVNVSDDLAAARAASPNTGPK